MHLFLHRILLKVAKGGTAITAGGGTLPHAATFASSTTIRRRPVPGHKVAHSSVMMSLNSSECFLVSFPKKNQCGYWSQNKSAHWRCMEQSGPGRQHRDAEGLGSSKYAISNSKLCLGQWRQVWRPDDLYDHLAQGQASLQHLRMAYKKNELNNINIKMCSTSVFFLIQNIWLLNGRVRPLQAGHWWTDTPQSHCESWFHPG